MFLKQVLYKDYIRAVAYPISRKSGLTLALSRDVVAARPVGAFANVFALLTPFAHWTPKNKQCILKLIFNNVKLQSSKLQSVNTV